MLPAFNLKHLKLYMVKVGAKVLVLKKLRHYYLRLGTIAQSYNNDQLPYDVLIIPGNTITSCREDEVLELPESMTDVQLEALRALYGQALRELYG